MLHPPLSWQGAHLPACGAWAVAIHALTALMLHSGYWDPYLGFMYFSSPQPLTWQR